MTSLFVAYGHKLYSHTHSYIHYGFVKAFKELGWDTMWIDENDKWDKSMFPKGTIFLTEGQVDNNIPILPECFYILHNVEPEKYKDICDSNKVIIQVNMFEDTIYGSTLSDISTYNYNLNVLYTSWATDLLPNEINIEKALDDFNKQKKTVVFIGSINNCPRFGNAGQLNPFIEEAQKEGYDRIILNEPFANPIDNNKQLEMISDCRLAPAIVGHWQQNRGYIPCRIFKNISYGCLGITNSEYVYNIFKCNSPCIFHKDSRQLFNKTKEFLNQPTDIIKNYLKEQMEYVRDNHTYLNRVKDILQVMTMKQN